MGVPEDSTCEKSWADTKNIVNQLIKDTLTIHEEVETSFGEAFPYRKQNKE